MTRISPKMGLIGIAVIVIMLFITAILVGVFSIASSATASALPISVAQTTTNSVNAINIVPTNGLSIAGLSVVLSGTTAGISTLYPITISLTGNSMGGYATNTVYATPGTLITKTYTITNQTATQTFTTNGVQFYNISSATITGLTPFASPTLTLTVTQTFNSIVHASGLTYVSNTISATFLETVGLSSAANNYNLVSSSTTTVLPFVGVVAIVGAVLILLGMFGLDDIFNFG